MKSVHAHFSVADFRPVDFLADNAADHNCEIVGLLCPARDRELCIAPPHDEQRDQRGERANASANASANGVPSQCATTPASRLPSESRIAWTLCTAFVGRTPLDHLASELTAEAVSVIEFGPESIRGRHRPHLSFASDLERSSQRSRAQRGEARSPHYEPLTYVLRLL